MKKALSFTSALILAISVAKQLPSYAAETIAEAPAAVSGADEFQRYCALCHGVDGRGLGPVADAMTRPAADLTQIAKRNDGTFPFEKVEQNIRSGGGIEEHSRSRMPAWGEIFGAESNPAQAGVVVLEITKFIGSIQEK